VIVHADSVEAVRDAVRAGPRVLPVGGATKPALSTASEGVVAVDVSGLRGILEYDPGELTFTALAGTPVAEVASALAEHGQHLPFDPPLAAAGATLGGTVAAGVSGSGAFRHGSVRDFVVGVRLVDGTGTLVAGGGKVVKNAAGFDLPKLMVGSMGRLGVLVELSFKVFPRPPATATLAFSLSGVAEALAAIARIACGPLGIEALDLEPPGRLLVRLGGAAETLGVRCARLEGLAGAAAERIDDDAELWRAVGELDWVSANHVVVRAALTARRVAGVEQLLEGAGGSAARYANAANVVWIAWPVDRALDALDDGLAGLGLPAMRITGPPGHPLLGARRGGAFAERIRFALDPHDRFPEA
jgi:glycolate oxidase FAD binding subunit